jgi:ABC-type transport system involved in multi-copper enzyme maturation permease subunit
MSADARAASWRELLADNPLVDKDAALATRRLPLAILLLVPTLASMFFAAVVLEGDLDQLSRWGDAMPHGRGLFATLLTCAMLYEALLLPVSAASSVANEREGGTWATLITTSLSPSAIIAGKALATGAGLGIFLAFLAPVLALCAWAGDIGIVEVLVALVALALHGAAQLSAGIYAGATAQSSRTAVMGALLVATATVTLPLMLPFLSLWVAGEEDATTSRVLGPVLITLGLGALLVSASCLVSARSSIAPMAVPRRPGRSALLGSALIALPVMASAALGLWPGALGEARDILEVYTFGYALLFGIIAGFAVVFEVSMCAGYAGAPLDAVGAPRAMARAMVPLAIGAVSLALVGGWVADGVLHVVHAAGVEPYRFGEVASKLLVAALMAIVFYAGVAGTTAIVARFVSGPVPRAAVTLAIGVAVLMGPVFIGSLSMRLESAPLLWANPLVMSATAAGMLDAAAGLTALEGPLGLAPWVAGGAFWAFIATLGAIVGPRR